MAKTIKILDSRSMDKSVLEVVFYSGVANYTHNYTTLRTTGTHDAAAVKSHLPSWEQVASFARHIIAPDWFDFDFDWFTFDWV